MITEFSFSQKRMDLTEPGTLQTSEQFFKSSAKHTAPDAPPKKNKELELSQPLNSKIFERIILKSYLLLLVHDQGAEHDLLHSSFLSVRADLCQPSMSSPNTNCALGISCDHSRSVLGESDDRERGFMKNLFKFVKSRRNSNLPYLLWSSLDPRSRV